VKFRRPTLRDNSSIPSWTFSSRVRVLVSSPNFRHMPGYVLIVDKGILYCEHKCGSKTGLFQRRSLEQLKEILDSHIMQNNDDGCPASSLSLSDTTNDVLVDRHA
jgi:hypothetical protein